MILKNEKGISFFQFPNLAEYSGIQHAVFTRGCGYSNGSYRSLNVSLGVGDDERNVERNRRVVSQCMEKQELIFAQQMHGSNVLVLSNYKRQNREGTDNMPLVGDAMVTDILHKNLVIQLADCQAVLMYDPVRQVVANVHSGWRGSLKNIIGRTVNIMGTLGVRPPDIIAGISPSLGPCCAEFMNYKQEIPKKFWVYKDGDDHFDFWSLSRDQLGNAGVLPENVCLSKMCTKCCTDLFYSYRGEKTTGRFAAVIGLK